MSLGDTVIKWCSLGAAPQVSGMNEPLVTMHHG
jgi:hypothetical protein